MDQESFERGLVIGLKTALMCVRDAGGNTQPIQHHIDELDEMLRAKYHGYRKMVRDDIYLRMPLMTAADLYGSTPPPGEGG